MNADDLYTLLIQLLMAASGAIARLLSQKEKHAIKFLTVISEVFISGFTALILYWITYSTEINKGYMFAAAGVAGWIGPKLMNILVSAVAQKSGIDLSAVKESAEVLPNNAVKDISDDNLP